MLLNKEWVNNEIEEKIKRYLQTNENENTMNHMGHSKTISKWEKP